MPKIQKAACTWFCQSAGCLKFKIAALKTESAPFSRFAPANMSATMPNCPQSAFAAAAERVPALGRWVLGHVRAATTSPACSRPARPNCHRNSRAAAGFGLAGWKMFGGVGCRAGGMCIRFVWGLSAWRVGCVERVAGSLQSVAHWGFLLKCRLLFGVWINSLGACPR